MFLKRISLTVQFGPSVGAPWRNGIDRNKKSPVKNQQTLNMKCIVPQNFNLLPSLYHSFVRVIRFITNKKYVFFCSYWVRL